MFGSGPAGQPYYEPNYGGEQQYCCDEQPEYGGRTFHRGRSKQWSSTHHSERFEERRVHIELKRSITVPGVSVTCCEDVVPPGWERR